MRIGLVAAAWLAGVLLGFAVDAGPSVALLLAGAAGLAVLLLWLLRVRVLVAVLATVLLIGLVRVEVHEREASPGVGFGQTVVATGSIADDPETTSRRVRFEFHVTEVEFDRAGSDGRAWTGEERWLVYASPPDYLVQQRNAPYFRYGDRVIVRGVPQKPEPIDGLDYPAYLASHGITTTMFAVDAQVTGEGGDLWRRTIFALRGRLADSIERSMPYPESALAMAVLLGKRGSLPEEITEEFRGTGAAHLLAISGIHVGVLLAVAAGAAAWLLGRQRPTYLLVAGAAIWLYVLVAGAPSSALRAAVMGTVYLAALGFGRPSSVLPALALAAALMTAASPGLVRQIGFQLSFAAVAGIALALAMWGGRLNQGVSPSSGWAKARTGLGLCADGGVSSRYPRHVAAGCLELWAGGPAGDSGVIAHGAGDGAAHSCCRRISGGGRFRAASGNAAGMDCRGTRSVGDWRRVGIPVVDGRCGSDSAASDAGVVWRAGGRSAGRSTAPNAACAENGR